MEASGLEKDGKRTRTSIEWQTIRSVLLEPSNRRMMFFAVAGILLLSVAFFDFPYMGINFKVIMCILPIIYAALLFLAAIIKKKHNPYIIELVSLFYAASFYLCVYNAWTYFASGSDFIIIMLATALLILPILYVSNSFAVFIMYILGCFIWLQSIQLDSSRMHFLFLVGLTIPYGIRIFRDNSVSLRTQAYLWVVSASYLIFFLMHGERKAFGIWIFVVYSYLVILYLISSRIYKKWIPFYSSPLRCMGFIGLIVLFNYASVSERWTDAIIAGANWNINIIFFLLLIVLCILYIERVIRGRIHATDMLLCLSYLAAFTAYIISEFYNPSILSYMTIFFDILIIITLATALISSACDKNRLSTNAILVITIAQVYLFYFPIVGKNDMWRLILIAGGSLIFILFGAILVKKGGEAK